MRWKRLFGISPKPEVTIGSIKCDTLGWELEESSPTHILWLNPQFQEMFFIHYFALRPDIPCDLSNLDTLRNQIIADIQSNNGELVELEKETVVGIESVRQIIKFPMNEDGRGRLYVASFTLPFEAFSFVIKVQCPEIGVTGMRESRAFIQLTSENKLARLENHPHSNDEPRKLPPDMIQLISTTADSEPYDKLFPDHPLSRARSHLQKVRDSLQVDDVVRNSPPFRFHKL